MDLLSLDVEGAEFEVLKTIDFKKQQFGVIFYEADEHNALKNEMMKSMLEANGYIACTPEQLSRERSVSRHMHIWCSLTLTCNVITMAC